MDKKYFRSCFAVVGFVVGFIFFLTTLQGCEPLRKKFTRQKKGEAQEQEYEPILDPIDYPAKAYDPKADYAYRYSLFHVWEKELSAGIDDRVSSKRLQYLLGNTMTQLEEMNKLVTEGKKPGLSKAMREFQSILQTVNQPAQFYNLRDVGLQIEQAAKPILNDYKPQLMDGNIAPITQ